MASLLLVPGDVLDELMARVDAEGAGLLGPDELLIQATKAMPERAMEEELAGNLGCERLDPARRSPGDSRNEPAPNVVSTVAGAVNVPKGTTRLKGFNDWIISHYARG